MKRRFHEMSYKLLQILSGKKTVKITLQQIFSCGTPVNGLHTNIPIAER